MPYLSLVRAKINNILETTKLLAKKFVNMDNMAPTAQRARAATAIYIFSSPYSSFHQLPSSWSHLANQAKMVFCHFRRFS